MKTARLCLMALATVSLGGCGASLPSLTTGAVFGGGAAAKPAIQNDPTSRAMEVGATSARAIKCGYNFDPAKLKNQFLTAETLAAKGADYCSKAKTDKIKEALNRHLAGDYTPSPPEPVEQDEGLFGGAPSSSSSDTPFNTKEPFEH